MSSYSLTSPKVTLAEEEVSDNAHTLCSDDVGYGPVPLDEIENMSTKIGDAANCELEARISLRRENLGVDEKSNVSSVSTNNSSPLQVQSPQTAFDYPQFNPERIETWLSLMSIAFKRQNVHSEVDRFFHTTSMLPPEHIICYQTLLDKIDSDNTDFKPFTELSRKLIKRFSPPKKLAYDILIDGLGSKRPSILWEDITAIGHRLDYDDQMMENTLIGNLPRRMRAHYILIRRTTNKTIEEIVDILDEIGEWEAKEEAETERQERIREEKSKLQTINTFKPRYRPVSRRKGCCQPVKNFGSSSDTCLKEELWCYIHNKYQYAARRCAFDCCRFPYRKDGTILQKRAITQPR